MNYIFDAGPMIALLANEPGADVTEDALTDPSGLCYAHVYNLAEVYYIYYRRYGSIAAEQAIQDLLDANIIPREDADTSFWKEVALLKGSHAIALPDAFCLALARRLGGTVVTTDHNEFDPLVPLGICPILFIR